MPVFYRFTFLLAKFLQYTVFLGIIAIQGLEYTIETKSEPLQYATICPHDEAKIDQRVCDVKLDAVMSEISDKVTLLASLQITTFGRIKLKLVKWQDGFKQNMYSQCSKF